MPRKSIEQQFSAKRTILIVDDLGLRALRDEEPENLYEIVRQRGLTPATQSRRPALPSCRQSLSRHPGWVVAVPRPWIPAPRFRGGRL